MTVVWHHEHHAHERYVAPDRRLMLGWIAGAVAVLLFLVGGGWFAWSGWRSGEVPVRVERVAWVPIGRVSGHFLWYRPVARMARGIAAADGRSEVSEADYVQAIDAWTRRLALEDLADKLDVAVDDETVASSVAWTDEIRSFLILATWSEDEYSQYIERPFILANRVEEVTLVTDEYQAKARETMDELVKKLEVGIAFQDVAHEYSEDPGTAQARGSLGYVLPSEVDSAFAPACDFAIGGVSDVLVTKDAYWVLMIEDRVTDGSGDRTFLRGIAVKKKTLADILDDITLSSKFMLWVR